LGGYVLTEKNLFALAVLYNIAFISKWRIGDQVSL
jgi:hypothetical protein